MIFVQLFGGLGIFIFGMKLISESLEKVAGDNLKNLLSSLTSHRLSGVFAGFLITGIIQSSSATTVMTINFVNAGLINLAQSISVFMGANIGTTLTAWIVNLSNIKFDIKFFVYFIVPIGVLFLFLRSKKINNWGNILIGLAFLFFGLNLLKNAVPAVTTGYQTNYLYNFIHFLQTDNFWSYLIFIILGTAITLILQSASATMALTITLVNHGYITVFHGAVILLGENLATSISANIAGIHARNTAKRSAISHTAFNLFGLFWILQPFIFKNFIVFCIFISSFFPFIFHEIEGVQLAIFHLLFNMINTLFCIWFIPFIVKIISPLFGPDKIETKFHLKDIKFGLFKTPDLALLEAQKEISYMIMDCYRVFKIMCELFTEINREKIQNEIRKIEKDINTYEEEIYTFLISLLREDTSVESTDQINIMLDMIRNLEWIGDSCQMIADLILKADKNENEISISHEEYFTKIKLYLEDFFRLIIDNLNDLKNPTVMDHALELETSINTFYKKLRKKAVSNMRKIKSDDGQKQIKNQVASGLIFMDIIKELEHIGDALKYIVLLSSGKDLPTEK